MNRSITTFLTSLLISSFACMGETRTISLEECRDLAINNNKELRMAHMRQQGAHYQRKAAFTKYLPKISATGMYMRTGDEISLLSEKLVVTSWRYGSDSRSAIERIGRKAQ